MPTIIGTISLPDGTLLISGVEVRLVHEAGEPIYYAGDFDLEREEARKVPQDDDPCILTLGDGRVFEVTVEAGTVGPGTRKLPYRFRTQGPAIEDTGG